MIIPLNPDEALIDDDVGEVRCGGCGRSLAELDERGHGSCALRQRIERAMPKPKRRHVVAEWPGLREALADRVLGANIIGLLRRQVEDLAEGVRKGSHASAAHDGRPVYLEGVRDAATKLRAAEVALRDLEQWEDRWRRG